MQASSTVPPLFFSSERTADLSWADGRTMTSAMSIGALRRLAGVEDLEPPGGAVDQVDDVVQPGGQEVDVLPVERGDEHPVEPGDHLVGDLVGLVLQPLDLIHDSRPRAVASARSSSCRSAADSTVMAATALNRSKNFSSRGSRRICHIHVAGLSGGKIAGSPGISAISDRCRRVVRPAAPITLIADVPSR